MTTQDMSGSMMDDPMMTGALQRADRWMATLAHELRDPLTVILLSLEQLHSICETEPVARLTREMARDGALHMSRIIEDVLDLYRGRGGTAPAQTGHGDLNGTVMAAVHTARPALARQNHRLSISLPPDRVDLQIPPSRIQQMLTNLLVNAAKFTTPGGEICLDVKSTGDVLTLSVADNGVGLPPELLSKVFEPYWQRSPGDRSGGLGLGLSLVQFLAELHGGSVAVYSQGPGKGSEFVVRLPNSICRTLSVAATDA